MEFLLPILIKMLVYGIFGIVLEIFFSSIKKVVVHGWNKDTKRLIGEVSILMLPVYAIFITFVFEPVLATIILFPAWIRCIVWMITFPTVEFLVGLFYDKVLHLKPWDYSHEKYNIMGYTKFSLIPWWGICGIFLESCSGWLTKIIVSLL